MKLRAIPGSLDLQQMNKNSVVDIELLKFICTALSSWGERIGRKRGKEILKMYYILLIRTPHYSDAWSFGRKFPFILETLVKNIELPYFEFLAPFTCTRMKYSIILWKSRAGNLIV